MNKKSIYDSPKVEIIQISCAEVIASSPGGEMEPGGEI